MTPLENKRVTVMGLGLHGGAVGTVRWLHEQGARITVTDLKSREELLPSLEALRDIPDITYVLGEHRLEDFSGAGLIIRNPGVSRDSEYLAAARSAGVPIEMDSSLFFEYCCSKDIIGITGSKGKSTATHAIAHLLQLTRPATVVVGFDRASPLGMLSQILPQSLVIFELSSWRLEALGEKRLSPHTAIVTSLYEDHLNTYDSFKHYVDAKKHIMRWQKPNDRILLNADDELVREWGSEAPGQVFWYSLRDSIPGNGIFIHRGQITVNLNRRPVELFPLAHIPLPSDHERRNVLPAILLGFMDDIPLDTIELNIRNLRGLAHRLERVRVLRGVTYINDSAATMPDATIAALKALTGKHIVHIIGGSDKLLRFDELAEAARNAWIRAFVVLPGTATPAITRELTGAYGQAPEMYTVPNMKEALAKAAQLAQPGDVVLLSPAATSFGLFKHEFDRGDQFKQAVAELK